MSGVIDQVSRLFFPPKHPESTEVTFKAAMDALFTQRVARITKAAVYALASIAATATLVLTECGVITWPLAIPSIIVSIVAGLVFYRLNSLDKRYVEMLDDKTRESVAKKELERLLLSEEPIVADEIQRSLSGINRLLGLNIFDETAIKEIQGIRFEAALKESKQSLAAFAFEQNRPIVISAASTWLENGYFSQPSYDISVEVKWNGNPADAIAIAYKKTEKKKENDVVTPVKEETVVAEIAQPQTT